MYNVFLSNAKRALSPGVGRGRRWQRERRSFVLSKLQVTCHHRRVMSWLPLTNDVKFVFPLKFTLPLCRLQLTHFNPAFYSLPLTIRPFKTLPAGRPLLVTRAALLKSTHRHFSNCRRSAVFLPMASAIQQILAHKC